MIPTKELHYRAFISYSHADSAVAGWLHKTLESYRFPTKLIGNPTPIGPVPRRLTPIFKDREELAASGDLSTGLKDALAAAQFLIVIASPSSAQSRWVNEEVRTYKQMHAEARVLVVIAAGEPNATDLPGRAHEECFPPAIRFRVNEDGVITDTPAEPIAADLRPNGDGKRAAKLKLIAGLAGLKLDDLVRREAQRRQRRMTWLAVAASALALVMSGLTVVAIHARAEAEHQRAEADGLVEFMLTDLRKKLEPVGRLDVLDVVGQRALKYYGGQAPGSLDADALGRRARALHLVGEVRNTRGDSEGALVAFHQAEATTSEQLARDPHNGQRIFDQAQSVFWVGYVAWQRGQAKEAETNFRAYKRYADELVQIDPKNADWQMEVSYADSNLGTLLLDQARYAEAETAFAAALKIVEATAARKPGDAAAQIEVGQDISWLATAKDRLNKTLESLALLRQEVSIYQSVLKAEPSNMTAKSNAVVAMKSIGRLELGLGKTEESIRAYQSAETLSGQLLAAEPHNNKWGEIKIKTLFELANALYFAGDINLSRIYLSKASNILQILSRADSKNVTWNIDLRSQLNALDGALMAETYTCQLALPVLNEAAAHLRLRASNKAAERLIHLGWAEQRAGDCEAKLGHIEQAIAAWKSADTDIQGPDETLNSTELAIRFAVLRRLGFKVRSERIGSILNRRDFRHPYYMSEMARTVLPLHRPQKMQ